MKSETNTAQQSSNNRKFNNLLLKISIVIFIIFSFGAWAFLTKVGAIPNFLGVSLLESPEFIDDLYENEEFPTAKKPVIYLYSPQEQEVIVRLDYKGEIIADYPDYNQSINGWIVSVLPDGTLTNLADGKEYSYIFWEGRSSEKINWDFSRGFVVKGEDTKSFLQSKLTEIGLAPREYNEFIVYWYPLMKDNKYNLITFAQEQYTNTAPLSITPKPDSLLRVFMVYKKLDNTIDIEPQTFDKFERKGFTVVEWGGTKAN